MNADAEVDEDAKVVAEEGADTDVNKDAATKEDADAEADADAAEGGTIVKDGDHG